MTQIGRNECIFLQKSPQKKPKGLSDLARMLDYAPGTHQGATRGCVRYPS